MKIKIITAAFAAAVASLVPFSAAADNSDAVSQAAAGGDGFKTMAIIVLSLFAIGAVGYFAFLAITAYKKKKNGDYTIDSTAPSDEGTQE